MILRIVLFYLLAFFFTFLMGGIQQAVGISTELSALPQWGPGLAGILMALIFRKDQLRLNFKLKEAPRSKFLWALLLPLIPAAVLFPIIWFTHESFRFQSDITSPIALLLMSLALGAVGEETGWRGYLHARLDRDLKPLVSSAIVALLWTLWHVGFYQNGALYVLFAVVAFTGFSITLYYLVREIDFNIWVASLFHFGINLASLFYISVVNQVSFMLLNALAWAVIATIVVIRQGRRNQNGRSPRVKQSTGAGIE